MGKYSEFERRPRDYYSTPLKATIPLFRFLKDNIDLNNSYSRDKNCRLNYIEPFCGNGKLIKNIEVLSDADDIESINCVYASDIEPDFQNKENMKFSGKFETHAYNETNYGDIINSFDEFCFISNPPWINSKESGFQLNTIIKTLSDIAPTFLLLDGNYMFNLNSQECMDRCTDVIPVGRVKWIEGSSNTSKENVAWYCFDNIDDGINKTVFHKRIKS